MHFSSPPSILIVDDEKDILILYKEIAKRIGCDVVCFTNPVSAFEHYRMFPNKYSLVITDLKMPGMCGIEFTKKIRKLNSTVKIYLVTAFDTSDIQRQQDCREAKFDNILEKPLELFTFQKIIEQDLSQGTK
jgi:CheY-like chemotaxis protein